MTKAKTIRRTAYTALLASLLLGQAGAANLEVAVQKVSGSNGKIKLMLFDREEGFRKEEKARQVQALPLVAAAGATTSAINTVFRELPPGRYAVVVYHDENNDGQLNRRFGMFPTEGYGLSTNKKPSGPPKFKDAAFDVLEGENRIVIDLNY